MKYAVEIKETLSKIVIVEAPDYGTAEQMVYDAYRDEEIILTADNSAVDMELSDFSASYDEQTGELQGAEVTLAWEPITKMERRT